MVIILSVAAIVLAAALAVVVKQRDDARSTLVSIGQLVESESVGAPLVQLVRSRVDGEVRARSTADALQQAIDEAPTGVVMLDDRGAVVYANQAATKYIDEAGDGAILRTRITSIARQTLDSGAPERLEVDLHDPTRIVLLLSACPAADSVESVRRATVYIEDLSARRRVDAMRTDFVTNASHELKTPLGAMSILAETLSITTDETQRKQLADRLTSEAARMTNVVDEILLLARTQSIASERQPVPVGEVLESVAESLHAHAAESGIEIVRGDVVDATVSGDRGEITTAVRNLILNAITYTQVKGGEGTVTYSSYIEAENVCIAIDDTGIGIPAKFLSRVFERFFRVDSARTRQSGGTGLGLSIVKNIAVAHGGRVYVESDVGVGSTFTLCLPLLRTEDP